MAIKVLLVDDEPHAIAAALHLLSAFPEINVVGTASNGVQAVKLVHELSPDVLLLDIHMPKLDGFDVIDLLGVDAPLVVFVTAYDEFAIKAFENNALDYLLKPLSHERLAKSIDRIAQRLVQHTNEHEVNAVNAFGDSGATADVVSEYRQAKIPLRRILIREKGDVFVVPVNDICAIEAADDYVVIQAMDKNYIKQDRLNKIENLLDSHQFCRIHRSSIINLDYLVGIETEGKDNRFAKIRNGKQFSISRSGYSRLVQLL